MDMKPNRRRLFSCTTVLLSTCQVYAASGDSLTEDWQIRRLTQPTKAELSWERHGHVMIYDGLTDRQVSTVLDGNFNRIQAMMFTGTVVTDESGDPLQDPVTGEAITENDGCD
jgi:hypothetical protein